MIKRWVVDTHVVISRLLAPKGASARALDTAIQSGVLLVSDATLSELHAVISRPKFARHISAADRGRFFELLSGISRRVHITRSIKACRDPEDDMFLDVAVNGDANAIITGDADLLLLHPFHGVAILSPSQFLGTP